MPHTSDTQGESSKILSSRLMGKTVQQDKFLLEEIYKGEKYVVFSSVKTNVHILPDEKLQALLSSTLNDYKEGLAEKLKGMKRNHLALVAPDYDISENKKIRQLGKKLEDAETIYNRAIDDILSLISPTTTSNKEKE